MPLQDPNPTPSFGGFGLMHGLECRSSGQSISGVQILHRVHSVYRSAETQKPVLEHRVVLTLSWTA